MGTVAVTPLLLLTLYRGIVLPLKPVLFGAPEDQRFCSYGIPVFFRCSSYLRKKAPLTSENWPAQLALVLLGGDQAPRAGARLSIRHKHRHQTGPLCEQDGMKHAKATS